MNNFLYVASRSGDTNHGKWGVIGQLSQTPSGGWQFLYLQGAKLLPGFRPFFEFPDLNISYESDDLFPLFANRLHSEKRAGYDDLLTWGGFDSHDAKNPPDPIDFLGVTEGRRVTDPIEVFPCPAPDAKGVFSNCFFIHGVQWMPEPAQKAILKLSEGEQLGLMPDPCNPSDPNAVAVRPLNDSIGRYLIGYIPRYLAADVCALYQKCDPDFIKVRVKRINQDAPSQMRLLCELKARWPDNFQPCKSEAFQPIKAEFPLPGG